MGEDIITSAEVCQILNVSRVTLWKYIKEGKIKAYRVGRKYLFSRKEVMSKTLGMGLDGYLEYLGITPTNKNKNGSVGSTPIE